MWEERVREGQRGDMGPPPMALPPRVVSMATVTNNSHHTCHRGRSTSNGSHAVPHSLRSHNDLSRSCRGIFVKFQDTGGPQLHPVPHFQLAPLQDINHQYYYLATPIGMRRKALNETLYFIFSSPLYLPPLTHYFSPGFTRARRKIITLGARWTT